MFAETDACQCKNRFPDCRYCYASALSARVHLQRLFAVKVALKSNHRIDTRILNATTTNPRYGVNLCRRD